MALQLEVVRSLSALEALAGSWERLAEAIGLPTLGHAWILACAKALYPEDDLYVITLFLQGLLVGVVPLVLQHYAGISRLELIGASALYEPSGLLYDSAESLDALLGSVLHARKPVLLSRIPRACMSRLRALAGRGVVMTGGASGTLAVPIASGWNTYVEGLSPQRRYDLRRARRRAEAAGRVRIRVLSPQPHQVDALFDDFVRIEATGWKARNGSSLSHRHTLRAFFREYARLVSQSGAARFSFLDLNDTPIAAQFSVEYANRLWVLKIGYDEAWSHCSPGRQLLAETMHDAFDRQLRSYEFLGTDERWLHGWTTEERDFRTVAWYPATFSGLYGLAADTTRRVRARVAARTHAQS